MKAHMQKDDQVTPKYNE